jgi:hypothetical protein
MLSVRQEKQLKTEMGLILIQLQLANNLHLFRHVNVIKMSL